jgi:hypothetical protein
MESGPMGQPAPVSTWLLAAKRKRSARRLVVGVLVVLLEIGVVMALIFLVSAFFPH